MLRKPTLVQVSEIGEEKSSLKSKQRAVVFNIHVNLKKWITGGNILEIKIQLRCIQAFSNCLSNFAIIWQGRDLSAYRLMLKFGWWEMLKTQWTCWRLEEIMITAIGNANELPGNESPNYGEAEKELQDEQRARILEYEVFEFQNSGRLWFENWMCFVKRREVNLEISQRARRANAKDIEMFLCFCFNLFINASRKESETK